MTGRALPLVQRCLDCRRTETVDRGRCARCGSLRTTLETCAATGTVAAVTTVHRSTGAASDPGILTIALVEVDGGATFMVVLPAAAAIGEPVDLADVEMPTESEIPSVAPFPVSIGQTERLAPEY